MLINLLANDYIRHPLSNLIQILLPGVNLRQFGFNSTILSNNILDADYWIIQAFKSANNPAGFRTAYKLSGKAKCLLIFVWLPSEIPEEGPFWCHILNKNLSSRIKYIDQINIPSMTDFENLIQLWPLLGFELPANIMHG